MGNFLKDKFVNKNFVYLKILEKNFKIFQVLKKLFRQRLYLFLKLGLSLGLFACTIIDPFEDITPPTLTISTKTSPLEKNIPNKIIFTFDENVSNFTSDKINFEIKEIKTGTKFLGDIAVLKNEFVTNSHSEYLLGITPKKSGNMTIRIPAYTVQDNVSNFNLSNFTTNFDIHLPSYTISFNLNGGSFKDPQITTLKVISNTAIEEARLRKILSYPPTGPKPGIHPVTRDIFQWQNNEKEYEFSTPVTKDLTLEAVWSNSCGKVETFHPDNRNELKTYTDKATSDDGATNLNHINTSAITTMFSLFINNYHIFEIDIACWNVSKVTDMSYMFKGTLFNQNIRNWNVSKVTDMSHMFWEASEFNQNIRNWDVKNVRDMQNMFRNASKFNQNISNWNVANVTDMSFMFKGASSFNQNISNWNVANVTDMSFMFKDASSFNQNIRNWDVKNVRDMQNMFRNASKFNQNISNWNVANVVDMSHMFEDASSFNQNISNWNVANVVDMYSMFKGASSFNQNLTIWPVRQVILWDDIFDGSAMEEKNKPQKFK